MTPRDTVEGAKTLIPAPHFYVDDVWEDKLQRTGNGLPLSASVLASLVRGIQSRGTGDTVAVYLQPNDNGNFFALSDSISSGDLLPLFREAITEPRLHIPEHPSLPSPDRECLQGSPEWPDCLAGAPHLVKSSPEEPLAQLPFDLRLLPHRFSLLPAPGNRQSEAPVPDNRVIHMLWIGVTLSFAGLMYMLGSGRSSDASLDITNLESQFSSVSQPEVEEEEKEEKEEKETEEGDAKRKQTTEPEPRIDLSEHFPPDARGTLVGPPDPTAQTFGDSLLMISDELLGCGSQGTRVFKGWFGHRVVAIKRLVKPLSLGEWESDVEEGEGVVRRTTVDQARREIALLIDSDVHPNVLRYYARKEDENFLYLALEMCSYTLADAVECNPDLGLGLSESDYLSILRDMLSGLRFLHSINIVHRDLKPQNILLTEGSPPVCKIADMGLGTKLDLQRSSFAPSITGGSIGWQAPEVLVAQQSRDERHLPSLDQRGGKNRKKRRRKKGSRRGPNNNSRPRLTKAVDVFSAGCVLYYVMSRGSHPFGPVLEREYNILHGRQNLGAGAELSPFMHHLIRCMIAHDPELRVTAAEAHAHPAFWSPEEQLDLLLEVSDVIEKEPEDGELRRMMESAAPEVLRGSWDRHVPPELLLDLGKYRKYNFASLRDLLRVLRNKKHHFAEIPPSLQRQMGPVPEGYLEFFASRFPYLLLHVWLVMSRFCYVPENFEKHLEADIPATAAVAHADIAALASSATGGKHNRRRRRKLMDRVTAKGVDLEKEIPPIALQPVTDGGEGRDMLPQLARFYQSFSAAFLRQLQNTPLRYHPS